MFFESISSEVIKQENYQNQIFQISKIPKSYKVFKTNHFSLDQIGNNILSDKNTGKDSFFQFNESELLNEDILSNTLTPLYLFKFKEMNNGDINTGERPEKETINSSINHSNINNQLLLERSSIVTILEDCNFQRPSFLIKKRQRKKYTKRNNLISQSNYKCEHVNCTSLFSSIKKRAAHHHKMNFKCDQDTLSLIKLISHAKKVLYHTSRLIKKNTDNNLINIKTKYEFVFKNIAHDDYFQFIAGKEFDDCLTDDDDENISNV